MDLEQKVEILKNEISIYRKITLELSDALDSNMFLAKVAIIIGAINFACMLLSIVF